MRSKEAEADYRSCYGEPIMKTKLEALERFGWIVYTREVFCVFREVLMMAGTVKVVGFKETSSARIFLVRRYCNSSKVFHVSYYANEMELRCSCLRMESNGLPCMHILGVLVFLDITELPKCLILDRWTKKTKHSIIRKHEASGELTDVAHMGMYAVLLDDCRDMCKLACQSFEDYADVKERVATERGWLRARQADRENNGEVQGTNDGFANNSVKISLLE